MAQDEKKRTSAYLPLDMKEALDKYVFANRKKKVSMNDCILEGLELFFKKHGIKIKK